MFKRKKPKSAAPNRRPREENTRWACNICTKGTQDFITLHRDLPNGGKQTRKIPIHLECLLTDKGREFIQLSIGLNKMPDNLSITERAYYMKAIGNKIKK